MQNFPIFFTFNDNYTVPACVALYSLLDKAKSDVFYDMYVLHTDISEENQNLIHQCLKKFNNYKLTFNNVKASLSTLWEDGNWGSMNKCIDKFPRETIIKCFATKFFQQYEKILYSDVDVIFVDDISEVYNTDLKSYYCAGVSDFLQKDYMAGGFILFNLLKMRHDRVEDKISEIIENDNIAKVQLEQDVLNMAFREKIKFISLNYISYPYLYNDYLKRADFKTTYSREELYDSIINPKIIHYASVKPWNGVTEKAEIWWDIYHYLDLPRTKVFESKYSETKITLKNIKNGVTLIFLNLPGIKNLLPQNVVLKSYNSIKKYVQEVLNKYE